MKRPRRERQHAWREHSTGRKLLRRLDRIAEKLFASPIGAPRSRLEDALFEDPRLKRLMGRA